MKRSLNAFRSKGLTLIEVAAALAILGVLLAGLSVLRGRTLRQWKTAQDQLQAVEAVDAMLSDWYATSNVPRVGSGIVPSTQLQWSLRRVESIPTMESDLARLEIIDRAKWRGSVPPR